MPLYGSSAPNLSGPLGFFGATPTTQRGPFVAGYAVTNWTMPSYTANTQTSAYTGGLLDLTQALRLTDGNLMRVAVENLRVFTEGLAQNHNALVADLKALGLVS